LGDKEGIWPVKKMRVGLLVVTFDWSFARLMAVVVTTASIIISTRDVKLDFFSKSKLESKKSIKTRNSFPVVSYSLTRGVNERLAAR